MIAVWVIVGLILVYLLLINVVKNWILFHPTKTNSITSDTDYEDVQIGGLHGWFVPSSKKTKKVILLCHGNAGNISNRRQIIEYLRKVANVFIFDYSGYGKSTGSPTESVICQDGQKAYDWLRSQGFRSKDIVLYGISLGGGVASYLAAHNKSHCTVLQSTFSGIDDFLPSGLKMLFPFFPNREYIRKTRSPVLVVHSKQDEIVPYLYGKRLYDCIDGEKEFFEITGGHNDPNLSEDYLYVLSKFLHR